MKLSIAWIFDHIDAPVSAVNVPALVRTCNQVAAEIEGFYPVTLETKNISLAQAITISSSFVTLKSPEWNVTCELPLRKDVLADSWYLIKKQDSAYGWATTADFHSSKDQLLPAVSCAESLRAGGWKQQLETTDYILEIDNKSITHRPDLWGHRGFAREVAAWLGLQLKPLDQFTVPLKVREYDAKAPATPDMPFTLSNEVPNACKRFAGLYIKDVEQHPSLLWMLSRLCRVDSKPIDAIVDITNYVMLDLSQPMHAFDADKIQSKVVASRFAHKQEKLTLLDGATITLTPDDLVITDGTQPISLAGIMGGLSTAVTRTTRSILLESACFDAATIRKASTRHKLRTDASARFEKSLDPQQNIQALARFVKLMQDAALRGTPSHEIASCGKNAEPLKIILSHEVLEQRLGVPVELAFVIKTLKSLDFGVEVTEPGSYIITVPSFRATKDVTIKEDIIEELGRFVGYTTLKRVLPVKQMAYSDISTVERVRTIKRVMAYALSMREVYNYALYDEEFLRQLQWQPGDTPAVQNPVSEHWRRLVTSLAPHLFKAVVQNCADHDSLRFFEWGRVWSKSGDKATERKALGAVLFEKKEMIDFYAAKNMLSTLFDALKLEVAWQKIDAPDVPWLMPYQSAHIMHQGRSIGYAGKVNPLFMRGLTEGDAFILELDGDYLASHNQKLTKFKPLPKYPEVVRDISMLVPLALTADALATCIMQADKRIVHTALMDFFQKVEWADKRSVTFRLTIQDATKTLTKEEVDALMMRVQEVVQGQGASIR